MIAWNFIIRKWVKLKRKNNMKLKHTKSPWKYNKSLYRKGSKETEMYGESDSLQEPICIIPHDDICSAGAKEVVANASLISAAPDMLDCLIKIYKDSSTSNCEYTKTVIEKATGLKIEKILEE
jgi:hypothetical protein